MSGDKRTQISDGFLHYAVDGYKTHSIAFSVGGFVTDKSEVERRVNEATEELLGRVGGDGPFPHSLFHYTTAEGLKGILETARLWASHISFLNDANELKYWSAFIKLEAHERSGSKLKELEFDAEDKGAKTL